MAENPAGTAMPATEPGNEKKTSPKAMSPLAKKPNLKKTPWLTEDLVLGWKVTKGLEPQHWEQQGARPGKHKLTDVVSAVPKSIAHHTVIIAQSGSGKNLRHLFKDGRRYFCCRLGLRRGHQEKLREAIMNSKTNLI